MEQMRHTIEGPAPPTSLTWAVILQILANLHRSDQASPSTEPVLPGRSYSQCKSLQAHQALARTVHTRSGRRRPGDKMGTRCEAGALPCPRPVPCGHRLQPCPVLRGRLPRRGPALALAPGGRTVPRVSQAAFPRSLPAAGPAAGRGRLFLPCCFLSGRAGCTAPPPRAWGRGSAHCGGLASVAAEPALLCSRGWGRLCPAPPWAWGGPALLLLRGRGRPACALSSLARPEGAGRRWPGRASPSAGSARLRLGPSHRVPLQRACPSQPPPAAAVQRMRAPAACAGGPARLPGKSLPPRAHLPPAPAGLRGAQRRDWGAAAGCKEGPPGRPSPAEGGRCARSWRGVRCEETKPTASGGCWSEVLKQWSMDHQWSASSIQVVRG
ncbi:unnamed protein product [Caretta caretta]